MWWLPEFVQYQNKKYILSPKKKDVFGTPEGTRTPDLLVRSYQKSVFYLFVKSRKALYFNGLCRSPFCSLL